MVNFTTEITEALRARKKYQDDRMDQTEKEKSKTIFLPWPSWPSCYYFFISVLSVCSVVKSHRLRNKIFNVRFRPLRPVLCSQFF